MWPAASWNPIQLSQTSVPVLPLKKKYISKVINTTVWKIYIKSIYWVGFKRNRYGKTTPQLSTFWTKISVASIFFLTQPNNPLTNCNDRKQIKTGTAQLQLHLDLEFHFGLKFMFGSNYENNQASGIFKYMYMRKFMFQKYFIYILIYLWISWITNIVRYLIQQDFLVEFCVWVNK